MSNTIPLAIVPIAMLDSTNIATHPTKTTSVNPASIKKSQCSKEE